MRRARPTMSFFSLSLSPGDPRYSRQRVMNGRSIQKNYTIKCMQRYHHVA